jgi:hypothetical protein
LWRANTRIAASIASTICVSDKGDEDGHDSAKNILLEFAATRTEGIGEETAVEATEASIKALATDLVAKSLLIVVVVAALMAADVVVVVASWCRWAAIKCPGLPEGTHPLPSTKSS